MEESKDLFDSKGYDFDGLFNLYLLQYKLNKIHADAVVHFNDNCLTNSSTVGQVLVNAGGDGFTQSCRWLCEARKERKQEISPFDVVSTGAGKLPYKTVLHSICSLFLDDEYSPDIEENVKQVENVFDKIFDHAGYADVETVALPVPHTKNESSELLFPIGLFNYFLNYHTTKRSHIKSVYVVDQCPDVLRALDILLSNDEVKTDKGMTVFITELDSGMVLSHVRDIMVLPKIYLDKDADDSDDDPEEDYLHPGPPTPNSPTSPATETPPDLPGDKTHKKKKKTFTFHSLRRKKSSSKLKKAETVETDEMPQITKQMPSPIVPTQPPVHLSWRTIGFDLNGTCNVYIRKEDITSLDVTCILNETGTLLIPNSSRSERIAKLAGPKYMERCQDYIRQNGPLVMGNVVKLPSGSLPCSWVLCVTCENDNGTIDVDSKEILPEIYHNLFEMANKIPNVKNLALCPLGYDSGFSKNDTHPVLALYQALVDYSTTMRANLSEITIVENSDISPLLSLTTLLMSKETVKATTGDIVVISRLSFM